MKKCSIIFCLISSFQFVAAQTPVITGKEGIVSYTIVKNTDTNKIVTDSYFKLDFKQYYNDSLLVDSKLTTAQLVHLDSNVSKDFANIFLQACKGDSIITVQLVDDLPNKEALPPSILSGGKLHTHYFVAAVFYDKKSAEQELLQLQEKKYVQDSIKNIAILNTQSIIIDSYLAKNKLKAIKTSSGLRVIVNKKGDGVTLKKYDSVTINYTGKLIDGMVFDSNTDSSFGHKAPYTFTLYNNEVIKGWDEGVLYFNEGGKGQLIIPSPLGFGEAGIGENIGKNEILFFDIDVLKTRAVKKVLPTKKVVKKKK
jgi:FKBP-type peptidyl-prolyl cis-trans isomerase FkpA